MEIKMPKFSARIKELRKEKGVTQVEMAEFLGCQPRHYQKIERGEINIPSVMLERLADYFEVSTDYLLGRSDNRRIL
ncbi:MAG: helix-turn-helix transcriptional regulator [Oscillospiraceae bacterium]|jgi:transcriptional regulator with XRE-family HTH domain|nr:helix-turn-helix transcriptional regulator [Oscillospiraceae bacterium]